MGGCFYTDISMGGINGENILICEAHDLYLLNCLQDEMEKVTPCW